MPAPAHRCARSPASTPERIATASSPLPSRSNQPTGAAYQPRGDRLVRRDPVDRDVASACRRPRASGAAARRARARGAAARSVARESACGGGARGAARARRARPARRRRAPSARERGADRVDDERRARGDPSRSRAARAASRPASRAARAIEPGERVAPHRRRRRGAPGAPGVAATSAPAPGGWTSTRTQSAWRASSAASRSAARTAPASATMHGRARRRSSSTSPRAIASVIAATCVAPLVGARRARSSTQRGLRARAGRAANAARSARELVVPARRVGGVARVDREHELRARAVADVGPARQHEPRVAEPGPRRAIGRTGRERRAADEAAAARRRAPPARAGSPPITAPATAQRARARAHDLGPAIGRRSPRSSRATPTPTSVELAGRPRDRAARRATRRRSPRRGTTGAGSAMNVSPARPRRDREPGVELARRVPPARAIRRPRVASAAAVTTPPSGSRRTACTRRTSAAIDLEDVEPGARPSPRRTRRPAGTRRSSAADSGTRARRDSSAPSRGTTWRVWNRAARAEHAAARLAELEHRDRGRPGRTTRAISRSAARPIGHVADAERDRRGVDLAVRDTAAPARRRAISVDAIGEPALRELALRRSRASARDGSSPITVASGCSRAIVDREIAGAGRDVEHARRVAEVERAHGAPPPAAVEAERQHAVHEVVARGDPVEHRAAAERGSVAASRRSVTTAAPATRARR